LRGTHDAFPRSDARPKITHCTLINDDLIRRMKALDAVPAMFTTYAYYNTDKFPFYGEPLMKRSMAYRTMLDAGAYASFEESIKGSISTGKLADFVILADDPHTVSPDRIKDVDIVRTVVGGTTMYTATKRR